MKTIVDPPHSSVVVGLAVTATSAATAGGDQFKVWVVGQDSQWRCSVVGSFLSIPCSSVVFSADESLICGVFGKVCPLPFFLSALT